MTIYYLYVKTHNKTGLKYLGQTSKQDPYAYCGSGKDWVSHLKEHGFTVDTQILRECKTKQELNHWGRYYSNLWNVVESPEWANRIPETGGGTCGPEAAKKISEKLKGRKKPPRNPEHTEKLAAPLRGKPNLKTAAGLRKYFDSNPNRSHIIEKQSKSIKEWYINNPGMAHKKALKTWDSRYRQDYEKFKSISILIGIGKTNKEIIKIVKVDRATINKLRAGDHRVFELFPELKEHLIS